MEPPIVYIHNHDFNGLCIYIYIYQYMYTCVYIYIYTYMYIRILYTYLPVYTYYIYIYTYILCIYICIHIYLSIYPSIHLSIYLSIYLYLSTVFLESPRPGRPHRRGAAEEGPQGFQGYGFRLSANRFEILRETFGLTIVVCLFLRVGAP